ncbi:hypothetical protein GOODEAATRI_013226 [Goodea atripinnis]|uniref:Uncharacterized protein n=1 Tax=Goodea atripinnis TaxID=208336 RepID=A0ABV0PDX3_9TELE
MSDPDPNKAYYSSHGNRIRMLVLCETFVQATTTEEGIDGLLIQVIVSSGFKGEQFRLVLSLSFFQEEMELKVKHWRVDRQVSCGGGIMEESGQLIQGGRQPIWDSEKINRGNLEKSSPINSDGREAAD